MAHEGSSPYSQQPTTCPYPEPDSLIPRLLIIFRNMINFLRWGVVRTSPNPHAGGPPIVGCPRLLIQYIRNYPPYLEAIPPSAT